MTGPGAPRFVRGPGVLLLALLLTIDLVLIWTHVNANIVGEPPEWPWWVDVDAGGPEFWQYVKFVWGAVAVLIVWWTTKRVLWLVTLLPFVAMLLDDSLTLHEQYGEQAGALLPIPSAWRDYQQFLGEFALLAVVGGVLLLAILVAALATRDRATRRRVWPFVTLLVLMAVFAGAIDLLHQWTDGALYEVVTLVEDGGEMLTASGLLAWAFHLATLPRGGLPDAETPAEAAPVVATHAAA